MVPLLLMVGEITPKVLAIRHNITLAGLESRPLEFFAWLIKPIRWVVRKIADWIITLIIGKQRSRGNIITEDMVRILAREAVGEGTLDHFEAQFIEQIFEFGNKTLEDVMTPRSDVFFLSMEMPIDEIIVEVCKSRHTKIPIYQKTGIMSAAFCTQETFWQSTSTVSGILADCNSFYDNRILCRSPNWPPIFSVPSGSANCPSPSPLTNMAVLPVWSPWKICWSAFSVKFTVRRTRYTRSASKIWTSAATSWTAACRSQNSIRKWIRIFPRNGAKPWWSAAAPLRRTSARR